MNIEMLKENFKEILEHETRAKYFYNHYIDQIDDEDIKGMLMGIRNDEVAHMKIAQELIDSV